MKKHIQNTFIAQLPGSVAILCIYTALYIALQQYTRRTADQIPQQYAEDTRNKLENGTTPAQSIEGIHKTDMQGSLSPFVIIYGSNGVVKASSTTLAGYYPIPPVGVLETAKLKHQNQLTWQPRQGVRNAVVILPYTINGADGYVLSGRSLREFEKLTDFESGFIIAACIFTLLASYIVSLVLRLLEKPKINDR